MDVGKGIGRRAPGGRTNVVDFEEWRLRRLRREAIDLAEENRQLGPLLREVEQLREELAVQKTG